MDRKLFIKMEGIQIRHGWYLWGQKELETDVLLNSFCLGPGGRSLVNYST